MQDKNKKHRKLQLMRHAVQIIIFLILPGLFALAFTELQDLYRSLIGGSFSFVQTLSGITELLIIVVATILFGRFFCGWFCAFGAYNDLIYGISRKLFPTRRRVNQKADALLKLLKYGILTSIVLTIWTAGSTLFSGTSPWDAFANLTGFASPFPALTVGFILLMLISAGAALIERFFCRYLCPLGAVFTLISRTGLFKISMPKDNCHEACKACTNVCSMGISLFRTSEVKGGECINCLKCVETCPRENAKAVCAGQPVDAKLVGSAAIAACVGLYGIGQLGAHTLLPQAQGTNVDTVAGETYTSSGILEAADEDLSQASSTLSAISEATQAAAVESATTVESAATTVESAAATVESAATTVESAAATPSAPSDVSTSASTSTSSASAQYKDGTYTGTGTGFRGGRTKVTVTIKQGKITSVTTVSTQDTPRYYDWVEDTMLARITAAQSSQVDTVSGATYSSAGIIQAVADALSQAV